MMRKLIIAAAATMALAAGVAFAAGEAEHPHDEKFSFDSPVGVYDMGAVQRGFAVYQQVCAACHSMDYMSYRHLGEQGGPFALYMVRNHETGEEEMHLGKPAHGGRFVPVTDNPYVRSIASAVQIGDTDPNDGSQIDRPGRISDHFRRPFANEPAARAANGGAYPPDLSVITSARHGGADYIYALLTGYTGEARGTQYVNRYFPGQLISMPPPLNDGAVTFDDGTAATVEQQARDVTTFLQWAADPHMETRKKTGLMALIFLAILAGLLYLSYKHVWRNESH
ncbi:ubiquinol cytochrome C oxidoreductase [alpha proteobacterium U9-1i]|nr:ubiquinol cytochrome C oxidoreductase [alpha proteobacterium U9-1i]